VAFGAGLAFGLAELIELCMAGALVAFGLAFGAGLVAEVFWSNGFLVAFGAGVAFGLAELIELCMAGALVAFGLAFGAGLAAMAMPVVRNAAVRSDAMVFFM
jgi:hypothetical protein